MNSGKMQDREQTGFSKRLFDLIVRRISADTENLVEVNFAGCHYPSLLGPPWRSGQQVPLDRPYPSVQDGWEMVGRRGGGAVIDVVAADVM